MKCNFGRRRLQCVKNLKIPPIPLTYEFDDTETKVLLNSMDNEYSAINNEMECDLECQHIQRK